VETTFIFESDDKGRIIRRSRIQTGQPVVLVENTYSYDAQGRMIADSLHSYWTQDVWRIAFYSYDQNNNVRESKTVDYPSGNLLYQQQSDYDSHPHPLNPLGVMIYLFNTEYDVPRGKNNLVKEKYDDGTIVDYTYEYYSNGLPKKCSISDNTDPSITYLEYYYE
jgi:hypothetical protein